MDIGDFDGKHRAQIAAFWRIGHGTAETGISGFVDTAESADRIRAKNSHFPIAICT